MKIQPANPEADAETCWAIETDRTGEFLWGKHTTA